MFSAKWGAYKKKPGRATWNCKGMGRFEDLTAEGGGTCIFLREMKGGALEDNFEGTYQKKRGLTEKFC